MIITIASGKGGTGKTTIATNLAETLARAGKAVQLLDTDVEAPNCHLFLDTELRETAPVNIPVPVVDPQICNLCGKCAQICEFNAIGVFGKTVLVFPELCHGCGGCFIKCPPQAIAEIPHETGVVKCGWHQTLRFITGSLTIGEAKAPPVIKAVKDHVVDDKINIIDAPPGTSCPMVEAVKGADYVILVTDPTPFGFHDLKLAVKVIQKLNLPAGVVINRSNIGDKTVHQFCHDQQIPILMKIQESRKIANTYASGKLLIDALPAYRKRLSAMFHKIETGVK